MADIDIKLFRSFLSVATEQNFSRAAERVGCSQATMSLRIQNLEGALGQKLFNRGYHQVDLSIAGKELLPRAQAIVDQHDALLDSIGRGKVAGTVRLGLAEDYVRPVLSRLLKVTETSFPGIELSITTMLSARLAGLVEARNLDLAIVTLSAKQRRAEILSRPKLCWVAADDFTFDSTKPWPLAFYPEGCVFRAAAIEALGRSGHGFRELLNNASSEVIRCVVGSGSAVTVMAEGMIPPGFTVLPASAGLPPLPATSIQLLERDDGLSKAAHQVKATIMNLLQG